jgi:hypothetical protein
LMHLLNARASTRYDSDNVANERQLASVYWPKIALEYAHARRKARR